MWNLVDKKYGGLHSRYEKTGLGILRCLDPVKRQAVEFGTVLHYENWLLHYLRPELVEYKIDPVLAVIVDGKRSEMRADLALRAHDGSIEIQVVERQRTHRSDIRCAKIKELARIHGYRFVRRGREEIRKQPTLIENLGRLRQQLVMYADHNLQPVMKPILQIVATGPTTRGALLRDMRTGLGANPGVGIVDAALFRLYMDRTITLHLGDRYDDVTRIQKR